MIIIVSVPSQACGASFTAGVRLGVSGEYGATWLAKVGSTSVCCEYIIILWRNNIHGKSSHRGQKAIILYGKSALTNYHFLIHLEHIVKH
jgi:hypothetical protein